MSERRPKDEPVVGAGVDLTRPVDLDTLPDTGDCFGKEWDPRTKECAACADSELCGLMIERKVKKKADQVAADKGPFLDLADFSGIDDIKLLERLGTGMTKDQVIAVVSEMSRCPDEEAVVQWLLRFIKRNPGAFFKAGIFHKP